MDFSELCKTPARAARQTHTENLGRSGSVALDPGMHHSSQPSRLSRTLLSVPGWSGPLEHAGIVCEYISQMRS